MTLTLLMIHASHASAPNTTDLWNEEAVSRRRREMLSGKTEQSRDEQRHVEDRQPKAESYQEMVDRVRRKQLSGK